MPLLSVLYSCSYTDAKPSSRGNCKDFGQNLLLSILSGLLLLLCDKEMTSFCTEPSEQIVYCHVKDVKMFRFFSFLNNDTNGL